MITLDGLLLDRLGDKELRRIARLKMEGHTNSEIAAELKCLVRIVERKVRRIRALWEDVA